MTSLEVFALGTAFFICLTSVANMVVSLKNWLGHRENKEAINQVQLSVNGRLDQLLEQTKVIARAAGVQEGAAAAGAAADAFAKSDVAEAIVAEKRGGTV